LRARTQCGGKGVYTDFVITTVVQEDASRAIRSSSPWGGYSTGVHPLTGFPDGHPLTPRATASSQRHFATNAGGPAAVPPPWPIGQEGHGPYQHGGMFPAVNGGGSLFSPPVVVSVQPGFPVGPTVGGYFKSETGCSVMSSFESMSATLSPAHWSLHSDPMHECNYPCDPIIYSYFGQDVNLTHVGVRAFQKQLYLCLLGAGLQRKTNIESWRSTNIWGILLWQVNEIWPTGGWGSLEYGTPVAGQVTGGRWKPLHHFLRASAYADVTGSCGNSLFTDGDATDTAAGPALCYVRNDRPTTFAGTVIVEMLHLQTGAVTVLATLPVTMPAGAGQVRSAAARYSGTRTRLRA